jgi:hypothetical protein
MDFKNIKIGNILLIGLVIFTVLDFTVLDFGAAFGISILLWVIVACAVLFTEKNFNNNYYDYRVVKTNFLSVEGKDTQKSSYHIEYKATRFGITYWKSFYEYGGFSEWEYDTQSTVTSTDRNQLLEKYKTFTAKKVREVITVE